MRVVLCLLILLFAGCAQPAGLPAGCSGEIPLPRVGDSAIYDAAGAFGALTFPGIGMWGPDDPASGTGPDGDPLYGGLILPDGSQAQITVGPAAQRLNVTGTAVDAHQVGYRLWAPERNGPLDAADEWLHVDTSRVVQDAFRHGFTPAEDMAMHGIRFTGGDRPPAMLAALFWGERIQPGWSRDVVLQDIVAPWVDSQRGVLQATYAETTDGCHHHFHIRYSTDAPEPRHEVRVVMGEDTALPIAYRAIDVGGTAPLSLSLTEVRAGEGALLPAWTPGLEEFEEAPKAPAEYGMPTGSIGVPLELDDAIEAVRQHDEGGAWLQKHADAVLASIEYTVGAPSEDAVRLDCAPEHRWRLSWSDRSGSRAAFDVDLMEARAPFCDGSVQVTSRSTSNMPYASSSMPELPSLPRIAKLHMAHAGAGIEYLECDAEYRYCDAGTLANTGRGPPGATSGIGLSGMSFSMDTGWLYREDGWHPETLGPPVDHPGLRG